jgi:hypothetical protein
MMPFPFHSLLIGAVMLFATLLVMLLMLRPGIPNIGFLGCYELLLLGGFFAIAGLSSRK